MIKIEKGHTFQMPKSVLGFPVFEDISPARLISALHDENYDPEFAQMTMQLEHGYWSTNEKVLFYLNYPIPYHDNQLL